MRARTIFSSISLALVFVATASAQKPVEPILPGADGTVCEFIALNAGRHTGAPRTYSENAQTHAFADMLVKRAAADVDGDGDIELLDYIVQPAGESPLSFGFQDSYQSRNDAPAHVTGNDDLRWWETGRWLYFRDAWHLIYFKDRSTNLASYVIELGKKQQTFACKFTPSYKETILRSSTPAVDAAYQAIIARRSFGQGTGSPLSQADKAYLSTLPGGFRDVGESLVGDGIGWSVNVRVSSAVQSADMDGDGVKERFARMSLASGATPPCGAIYFELLPVEGATEPDPAKRDLWRDLQSVSYDKGTKYAATCGLEHDILEIDGVGYLYSAKWDYAVSERRLSRLNPRSNTLSSVKFSQFEAEHIIDYDAAK